MPRQRCFLLFAVLAVGLCHSPASAQQPAAPTTKPSAEPTEAKTTVRQVGPSVFFAWDEKDQKYKAILDLTLEDHQKLYALREKPADEAGPARYHFAEAGINLAGSADQRRAEFTLTLGIETRDEDWLAVPLRLNGTILQSAKFQGPGSHFIEYDDTAGHMAWIRPGAKEAKYQLELKLLAPLAQVGDESRLDIKLPRISPIKLALQVPTPNAQGAVSSGAQITSTTAQGDGTRFEVQASNSDLKFAWQGTRQPTSVQRPAVFDAVGKVLARVESQTRITWDATFTITVQQGDISGVSIRLPPGASLVSNETASRPSMDTELSVNKEASSLIDVEFERPLQKGATREVRLTCERLIAPRGNPKVTGIDVGGFEVIGAAQQRGHIGLVVGDAWRCDAMPSSNVVRDDVLPDGFREAGVLGSDNYRYISRPTALLVDISPRRKKLTLTPTYLVNVQADRVSLEARLRYQVLGARTDACRVDLPGWEIDAVELVQPGLTETREPIDFDPFATEPLAVNLPRTMRGEFEVRIRARHELPVDAIDFSVALPRPAADEREAAVVVLQAANNIELRFRADESRGLVPLDIPSPVQLPPRQQPPIVFHERLDELDATLAAELDVRSREIRVASLAQATIGQTAIGTTQRLEYNVRFEPIRRVLLAAPSWLAQHEALRVTLNGTVLPPSAVSFLEADAEQAGTARMQIDLPQLLIGRCELELKYEVSMSPLKAGVATPLTVTVLTPVDEQLELTQNQVEVLSEPNLRIGLNDKAWRQRDTAPAPGSPLLFAAQQPASRLELTTTFTEQRARRTTVVEKLWLQTWIAGAQRRERAVFQLSTNDDRAVVHCPADLPRDELVLIVDGQNELPHFDDERTLVVDLPKATDAPGHAAQLRRHVIELCWPSPASAGASSLRMLAPEIIGAWVRQVYWHVVMPREQLAMSTPAGMSADMVWAGWGRQTPRLNQAELEAWSGATLQDAPTAGAVAVGPQQYLFSSVGAPSELRLRTFNAAMVMFAVSLVGLAIVLTLVLVPAARHPAAFLIAGCLLLLLALVWPTLAVLLAQCIALVIVVVVSAQLLERYLWRKRIGQRPFATSPAPVSARRRRPTELPEPSLTRPSTTATAALSLPLAQEAKS